MTTYKLQEDSSPVVSYFKRYRNTDPAGTMSLGYFILAVKNGKWKDEVEKIRAIEIKKQRDKAKGHLLVITPSALFYEKRSSQTEFKHSGHIVLDFDADQFENEQQLQEAKTALGEDSYCKSVFYSISGRGLCSLHLIDGQNHKDSFRWLRNRYFDKIGILADPAPTNPASTRTVTYDPDLIVNATVKPARTLKPKPPAKSLPILAGDKDVEEMINYIVSKNIDVAPGYHEYFSLAAALAAGFGERGRHWFHKLCSVSKKYKPSHAEYQYTQCLRRKDLGISVGTFYHMMKEAGCEMPQTNKKAINATILNRDRGNKKEDAVRHLTELNNLSEEEASSLVNEVYNRNDINLNVVSKDPANLIENLVEFIKTDLALRKNTITSKIEYSKNGAWHEIDDESENTIYLKARSIFNSTSVTADLVHRIIHSTAIDQFNPLTAFIEDNGQVEAKGEIAKIIASIDTPTPAAGHFIKKWLHCFPATMDGNIPRLVLCFSGKTHIGKTHFFTHLLPDELKDYYAVSELMRQKDDEILLSEKLLVVLDEMTGIVEKDDRTFKSFISREKFSLRPPYGKYNKDYRRLAVIGGTTEDFSFITDFRSNTRIIPIYVNDIDHAKYNNVDKKKLFIELWNNYKAGESYQLSDADIKVLSGMSEEHESIPVERELLLEYFAPSTSEGFSEEMTASKIKSMIERISGHRFKSVRKFGIELRHLFGKPKSKRIHDKIVKLYDVVRKESIKDVEVEVDENVPF